jgi:hypothetical protein
MAQQVLTTQVTITGATDPSLDNAVNSTKQSIADLKSKLEEINKIGQQVTGGVGAINNIVPPMELQGSRRPEASRR